MKGATMKPSRKKTGKDRPPVNSEIKTGREQGRQKPPRFSISHRFSRHQETAVESLARLLSTKASSILTWSVIGIALALPVCLLLLVTNLQQLGSGIDDSASISLYLDQATEDTVITDTVTQLSARDDVSAVVYISASQGLEDFAAASDFDDVLAGLDENPLPAVIQVTPASVSEDAVRRLLADLEALVIVDQAVIDLEWVQKLNAMLEFTARLTIGLAVLLCLGVLLVIGNTIRLAIENRRAEIVVVKLVGGTNAYVARPFLYTGLWYGVGGGLVAALVVTLGLVLLYGPVSTLAGLYGTTWSLTGWDASGFLLLLAGGGLLGWAGAWLAVLRHLRAIEP